MSVSNSPLTPEHLAQINQALGEISKAEEAIKLAKQAEVDVGNYEKDFAEQKRKLLLLKRVYFPGQ